jgi:hypothetical protein
MHCAPVLLREKLSGPTHSRTKDPAMIPDDIFNHGAAPPRQTRRHLLQEPVAS